MSDNKKVLKGLNFPGLEGTYYIPEAVAVEEENGYIDVLSIVSDTVEVENLDATLTKEGFAADAKAVGEALAEKAPKSYILHGTTDGDNATLTNFDWDELLAAINSEEHCYIAVRLVDGEGCQYEYPFKDYVVDEEIVHFISPDSSGVKLVEVYSIGNISLRYSSYHPDVEAWVFTLEDGSTVTKVVSAH